jgi:hypothetical protein
VFFGKRTPDAFFNKLLRKQYTTVTFEQMRQQMEAAVAKAKAEQSKQQEQPQQPSSNDSQNVDLKFNIKVRNTGASKDVAGLSAKESIMTMTVDATDQKSGQTGSLAITTDMYLAPDIPGYDEVRDFDRRYAIKMGTVINGAINPQMMAMMQQPAAGKLLHTRRRHRSVFGEHNGKRRSSALSIHIGPDPDRTAVLIDELLAHP